MSDNPEQPDPRSSALTEASEAETAAPSKWRIIVGALLVGVVTGSFYSLIGGSGVNGGIFFGLCMTAVGLIGGFVDRYRATPRRPRKRPADTTPL